jgi:hypothetical protein
MNTIKGLSLALTIVGYASSASSADFSQADQLFARRGESQSATVVARAAYENLLPELNTRELVYAVSRMAQLDVFFGERFYAKEQKAERRAHYGRCADELMPKILPSIAGETPEYYYWRGACLALLAESSTTLQRVLRVPLMKELIAGGEGLDTRYYGGGIFRVFAGIASNPDARAVGLYNPQLALTKLNTAIDLEPYPGESLAGKDYYSNYRYKVETLIELGQKAEALAVATTAIEEIDELIAASALPEGQGPETITEHIRLKGLRAKLEAGL